ncbi:MAG: DEAD/DEAH box helicase [Sideroxydans sp.]|nr:DEAD/DEAH box helicase [Sideroxydans sp.]
MSFTPYHSQYLAHRLTLEGVGDEAFARSLSAARVEMKPHQVDAALFALKSPLSKGAILADEVGLGKTIEAGLVIAQRWAEQRRRILLIVPASLRKQWTQELQSKFTIPTEILESKSYRERQKAGNRKPFEVPSKVVVTSYEFAARQADEIASIQWDLVVFDEAHRLRNVFKKNGSQRAKQLRRALQERFKILLTATPLQNSLLELYGLVSVVDDKFFGDENSFKARYGKGADAAALAMLRERLQPISRRTLRKQVLEAGHISYTKRLSNTFQFEPRDNEVELYEKVSAFLRRKDTIAFGDKPNQLVTLVVRKILGSSTSALVQTLEQILARLEKQLPVDRSVLTDIDTADEIAEEMDDDETDPQGPVDPVKLAAEIAEVRGFVDLAKSIGANAKGEKLVAVLPTVLDEIVSRGGQRKAVIFTESVRTQTYLRDLLAKNGFENDIALMNGSNNDPESKAIYEAWKARHKGTDAISGSKSADMKAAIVEAFRDSKSILIATESGAEGINLQFCSLLINFDLPWNPQRVEQRIGRCHRYGQKIDVTVVNLLNLKNQAELRVHQLLEQKFLLFSGVFGASDEVLGAIEKGVDFERRVLEIVQTCRSDEQVVAAFKALEDDLQLNIDADMLDARKKLLENLDQDVVRLLQQRNQDIEGVMNAFDQRLMTLAKAELPDAKFHDGKPRFDWDGITWTSEWPLADDKGWGFFRLSDGNLATELAERAKARNLPTANVSFRYSPAEHGVLADVNAIVGKSGWLTTSILRVKAAGKVLEQVLLAAVTDDGAPLEPATAERLFLVPGTDGGPPLEALPDTLRTRQQALRQQLGDEAQRQSSRWFTEEEEKLERYGDDLEKSLDAEIDAIDEQMQDLKRAMRQPNLDLAEKVNIKRQISGLDGRRDELIAERYARKKRIRDDINRMLDEIAESLRLAPEEAALFTIRWTVK